MKSNSLKRRLNRFISWSLFLLDSRNIIWIKERIKNVGIALEIILFIWLVFIHFLIEPVIDCTNLILSIGNLTEVGNINTFMNCRLS